MVNSALIYSQKSLIKSVTPFINETPLLLGTESMICQMSLLARLLTLPTTKYFFEFYNSKSYLHNNQDLEYILFTQLQIRLLFNQQHKRKIS